jgi:hypothetical protein
VHHNLEQDPGAKVCFPTACGKLSKSIEDKARFVKSWTEVPSAAFRHEVRCGRSFDPRSLVWYNPAACPPKEDLGREMVS